MLIELAIGDAYGAGFEYVNKQYVVEHNDLSIYVPHPRHNTGLGRYTDDTQMTIAIVEAMLSQDDWTPETLAKYFVEAFQRDPREGYAGRFYTFLQSVANGTDFLNRIIPISDKSGAAMRAIPIGLFPNIRDVKEKCTIQAKITHNTPDGINAAIATSLMAHYFIYDLGKREHLGKFINKHVDGDWDVNWTGKVKSKGWMSVQAAITAVQKYNTLSELLRACIDYGGDVDTVATIALGAASCSKDYTHDLPSKLYDDLEDEEFGKTYLFELDQKLMKLFGRES